MINKEKVEADCLCDVDGFFYYWPEKLNGCLAAHHLRFIADVLDAKNEPHNKQINEYFAPKEQNQFGETQYLFPFLED